MQWREKLNNITHENNSLVCIGLDIDKQKIPKFLFETTKQPYLMFNKKIIDSTKDIVCAYKLNMAFYENLGLEGIKLLQKTVSYIPKKIFVIIDGKRNDIGNTAAKYAQTIFDTFHADATTVNPYLGKDGIQPFLAYTDKCSFILCRTSNPSAGDFQDLLCPTEPLYQIIAKKIKEWNINGNCGVVVGATYPDELRIIRRIIGDDIPLLIPGIGTQGGEVQKTIVNGTNSKGEMAIINSSRGIIYAGNKQDFAYQSRQKTLYLRDEINKYNASYTKH
ncbi:MAG: orotidine-5'-phosphate decarboxylase [Thermoplasmatota archaeon]